MPVLYPGQIRIWKCQFLLRVENWPGEPEEKPSEQSNHQDQTHIWHAAGIKPWPHGWEVNVLTTVSTLLPIKLLWWVQMIFILFASLCSFKTFDLTLKCKIFLYLCLEIFVPWRSETDESLFMMISMDFKVVWYITSCHSYPSQRSLMTSAWSSKLSSCMTLTMRIRVICWTLRHVTHAIKSFHMYR